MGSPNDKGYLPNSGLQDGDQIMPEVKEMIYENKVIVKGFFFLQELLLILLPKNT